MITRQILPSLFFLHDQVESACKTNRQIISQPAVEPLQYVYFAV